MKKTQKTAFGLFGLSAVAAMTIFAATLPGPEASATTSTSAVDTFVVRVVGAVPDVNVSGIINGSALTDPNQNITIVYENVEDINATIQRKDKDGTAYNYPVATYHPDYVAGSAEEALDLNSFGGYGEYTLSVIGVGFNGVPDPELIKFSYWPAIAVQDPDTGNVDAIIDTTNEDIQSVVVTITDKDGKSTTQAIGFDKFVDRRAPISTDGLVAGTYTISVAAYGSDGEVIYRAFSMEYVSTYVPGTGAPDTGGLFHDLNISKEDYLITGLIVFFVLGIVAFGIVAKNRNKSNRGRK